MPTATALSWQVKRVLGAALLFPGARQAGKMKIPAGWGMERERCRPCSIRASRVIIREPLTPWGRRGTVGTRGLPRGVSGDRAQAGGATHPLSGGSVLVPVFLQLPLLPNPAPERVRRKWGYL